MAPLRKLVPKLLLAKRPPSVRRSLIPMAGTSGNATIGAPLINAGQLGRPFPQYTDVNLAGFGWCGSTYNSLQVSATRRFQWWNLAGGLNTNAKNCLATRTPSPVGWRMAARAALDKSKTGTTSTKSGLSPPRMSRNAS